MGPTSTSQDMHHRLSVGAQQQHPQPQQPLGLYLSPSSVATLQPLMQLGKEKRGRGRPRKYAPAPAPAPDVPPAKRARGPPPLHKKLNASARSWTPHIINVKAGEDIAAKIVAFTQQGPLEFSILSASGAVSSAMLLHSNNPNNPTGVVKYEGQYEIIGMSGSFLNTDESNSTGNLSVFLANHNGNIVGGFVAGRLVAGSQVLVVVGSFAPERVNQSAGRVENNTEPASASSPTSVLTLSGQGLARSSESSEENDHHARQQSSISKWFMGRAY